MYDEIRSRNWSTASKPDHKHVNVLFHLVHIALGSHSFVRLNVSLITHWLIPSGANQRPSSPHTSTPRQQRLNASQYQKAGFHRNSIGRRYSQRICRFHAFSVPQNINTHHSGWHDALPVHHAGSSSAVVRNCSPRERARSGSRSSCVYTRNSAPCARSASLPPQEHRTLDREK